MRDSALFLIYLLSVIHFAESNRRLPHLFIPSKTATLVLEFAVEDLPLDRTSALMPEFAVKDLHLGRTLMMKLVSRGSGQPYVANAKIMLIVDIIEMGY